MEEFNQSTVNMAAPHDQSMNELASDDESMAKEEASNTDEPELGNHSATHESASENLSTTNVASTSSQLGLLSLPPELRLLVFRHLLLEDHPLSTYACLTSFYRPFTAILNTCKQIREEAFQVLYGENFFRISFVDPVFSILNNQQICDTIQNIHFNVKLIELSLNQRRLAFFRMIRELLSSAIIRGTLRLLFFVSPGRHSLPPYFIRILPTFTKFRIIQIEVLDDLSRFRVMTPSLRSSAQTLACDVCKDYESTLTPVFGPARSSFAAGRGRLFRPQAYLNSLPPKVDVDWMEYLDGIRLD